MVLFNYSTKEITAKVVYYGPGLCGKTTNLQFIYDNMPKSVQKGRMLSLATKTDRTLFFDFLPLDLGMIRDMKTRIQLYTVPGQVFYNSTRKLVLKGADGIVFVADSQQKMKDANIESFANLEENCVEAGIDIDEIPLVLQFNKRDLPEILSLEEMNDLLNKRNSPFYETVATTGIGVHETLKGIAKLVLHNLQKRHMAETVEQSEPMTVAMGVPAGPAPVPEPKPVAFPEPLSVSSVPAAAIVAPEPLAPDALPESAPSIGDVAPLETQGFAASTGPVDAPVIEGLLRRAACSEPTSEAASADPDPVFPDGEPFKPTMEPVDRPEGMPVRVASVSLEESDPLGLQTEPPMAPRATLTPPSAVPVVVQPGQDEVQIPLEVRSGDTVQRYRLRLQISLGRDT